MKEVSNVIGNHEKTKKQFWKKFSFYQDNELITSDIMSIKKDKSDFTGLIKQNSRYFLQIQNGCDHRCTFCIIPYGRGNSRSVTVDKILDNVNEALQNNFKEIVDYGFRIKHFKNHSDLCLAGEDKEFISKFMTKSGQSIFKPAEASEIFSKEDFVN